MQTRRVLIQAREIYLLIALCAMLGLLNFASSGSFSSVEVKFADASPQGLSIVPASCPSHPHSSGDCGRVSCRASVSCANSTTVHTVSASCNVQNTPCPAGWSCASGACIPPPPPVVEDFVITLPDGTTLSVSGHLRAQPVLVRSGDTTHLYWNMKNVGSCTVTGTNGDSFSGASSGPAGTVSGPITTATTFTLTCAALTGATPPNITESLHVNIAPIFQEL